MPHETAAVLAQVLCTPYNHAPCHFMQSHIRKVYVCSAVTCHLHFWQNDQDLLHATAVTHGWNSYQNKSQHRKLTLEKKILLLLLQGFKPATFQAWVWRSNHWAIPAPLEYIAIQSKLLTTRTGKQRQSLTDSITLVTEDTELDEINLRVSSMHLGRFWYLKHQL